MERIVIIGGGIAGLSAAYYAQKKAEQASIPLEITVLEAEKRWGGKISTERLGEYVIEGGPDTFLATKPWGVSLCRELGLGERLQGTNPLQKNTYVLYKNQLRPLPDGLSMMIPTRFGPMLSTSLLSWPAKARMGFDFVIPARTVNGDESLGAFVSRRLGRKAYENLIEPLMSGIYAGDGDQLSLQATFPYLRELELKYGGLGKGALAARKQASRAGKSTIGSRSAFLTPTTGLAEIVEVLTNRLESKGVTLINGIAARCVTYNGNGYHINLESGDNLETQRLILATQAFASGELLKELDPEFAAELSAIPYTSTATVSLAYSQSELPRPLDGYGYVIPRREGRQALACTWTSTKFPHRAPNGFALLRVFIGRAGQENEITWDEGGLLDVARQELRLTLGINTYPLFHRVFVWERAMPQYNLGHPERLKRLETAIERWPGLALAGNGYRGIGIPDCIHSGELAAETVFKNLEPARIA